MSEERKRPNNIILENRERLSLSGISEIESFDEEKITMMTDEGGLIVKGNGLKIDNLDVNSGDVLVNGRITAVVYSEDVLSKRQSGFFAKLFK